jgi:hypothetical protein
MFSTRFSLLSHHPLHALDSWFLMSWPSSLLCHFFVSYLCLKAMALFIYLIFPDNNETKFPLKFYVLYWNQSVFSSQLLCVVGYPRLFSLLPAGRHRKESGLGCSVSYVGTSGLAFLFLDSVKCQTSLDLASVCSVFVRTSVGLQFSCFG